jgi:hypothetical protein
MRRDFFYVPKKHLQPNNNLSTFENLRLKASQI